MDKGRGSDTPQGTQNTTSVSYRTLGDSLSRKIDEGLANSRFGVVILSPSFFKKEWPRKELDGLTAKEISYGKAILPVWHKVGRDDVLRYSPILADKLAVSTSEGLEKIVAEILRALERAESGGAVSEHDTVPSPVTSLHGGIERPSSAAAVGLVKQYLAESRRIPLHDLIHKETENAYQEFASDRFACKGISLTKEMFQGRMHEYEALVERLVAMLAALSYYDTGDNSDNLTYSIERLAEQSRHDGLVALLDLQLYPALLTVYAGGISALAAGRFRNLAAVLRDTKCIDRSGRKRNALRELNVWSVFQHSYRLTPRPSADREYTPANNHLFDLLRPLLHDYSPSDKRYEDSFDIFEYLLALTYLDVFGDSWSPVGGFGWRVKNWGWEETAIAEFVSTGLERGAEWGLLKAGFFNGSIERFKKIAEIHTNLLQKQTQGWI